MARGNLRVYLGAAPGVGKTFAMLNEGRRRHDRGTDVVVGFVETHGRARTIEQIGDLEVVPRKVIDLPRHRVRGDGRRRRARPPPEVALVDELAHTNVPGSPQREALAGRRGAARGRHRRHLDGQHPAPRVGERRRRAHHRRAAARDAARRGRAAGRPGRARRQHAGGAAPAHGARQHLQAGEGRRRARELLPARATSPRCASSRCSGSPTRSTRACSGTWRTTASRPRGRRASGSSWPDGRARRRAPRARASRIATRAKGDLLGVHVRAGEGLAGPPPGRSNGTGPCWRTSAGPTTRSSAPIRRWRSSISPGPSARRSS